jgi:hypothetical protein
MSSALALVTAYGAGQQAVHRVVHRLWTTLDSV